MFKKFFIVFLVFSLSLSAQQKSGSENRSASLLHEVSNKEIISSESSRAADRLINE